MDNVVYKIEISSNLYQGLFLKNTLFSREQDAIDSVSQALRQRHINFTMKQTKNSKVFINTHQGELATILPVKA